MSNNSAIKSGGSLILVATPIGNLGDMTQRAVETLQSADVICCEDTRHSGKLLAHFGVTDKKLIVINEHTEYDAREEIVALVVSGSLVALITDAGTPGISDPGERLVTAVIEAGGQITAVPGASALTMALVISGLPTSRFVFEGFLPRSGIERTERLAMTTTESRTIVLYEAPHRLVKTLSDLTTACGAMRRVVLARELTKLHEEIWRGTLQDANMYVANTEPRGEYVIIIEPAKPPAPPTNEELLAAIRAEIAKGVSRKDSAARVSARFGVAKRTVYELALQVRDDV
ncbi:MAG: 16S rRNA (cytidine(1402)-2'-O)-methyltransferase [Ilumatobacteraceae bacterium]|jgi:16S rRNA (cytidine1402-2'-O)-methyltransferase|nr:16S rRNA (cytidine(1402)-2'-O)-methyltransferase [Ilumatobacteraceae bacterium]